MSLALAGPALAALPTITNIIPRNGTHVGGTGVTIYGTNFSGATAVKFGPTNAASFTVNSSTTITAFSPPGAENTSVKVTVTTPEGTNETSYPFFYFPSCREVGVNVPEITSVEPHSGPVETRVTLKGFSLAEHYCGTSLSIERVLFGFTEALHFERLSETEFRATAPPVAGTVEVTVEDPLGRVSADSAHESDQFTGVPPATNHWYENGSRLPEGESVPIVMFGGEINLGMQNGLGGPDCKTVGGGTVENPVGGAAGVGRTNSFDRYECKAPQCEKEVKERTGLEGRLTVTTENNPAATNEPAFPGWNDELEESFVGGVFSAREKIGEPFVTFKTPSPPGMIRETEDCTVPSTGQVLEKAIVEGEVKPEIGKAKTGNLNGTSATTLSQMKFNGKSTGGLHSSNAGEETWAGNLKYLGYFHQEAITVKP